LYLRGPTSKGRAGEEREGKGREREEEGEVGEGKGQTPQIFSRRTAPPLKSNSKE